MSTPVDVTSSGIGQAPDLDFASTEALRYQRPELPPLNEVARYYALSEDARFYSNGGPCYERLSTRLAAYVGAGVRAVPVGNCTLGLIVALRETCGEPRGGRRLIAVPAFTFTASACAIRWAGFEPLFVDVDAESWQLAPAALEDALARYEGRIAGVMGCSTFGTPPPSDVRAGWRRLGADAGVPLLIDSAAAFGAVDEHGALSGSQGDTEIFSFHATKPFAIGEGGTVLTSDPDLAGRIARSINFGIDPRSKQSLTVGLNAKLSELHAATGLAMLDRFDDVLGRRRSTARDLQELFGAHPVSYQAGSDGSTWQVLQLLVPDAATRLRAVRLAAEHNIEVRTCFDPPLHRQPAFADAPVSGGLPMTEMLASRALSLPMANTLGPRQKARLVRLMDATLAS